jgi:hypothetical protein
VNQRSAVRCGDRCNPPLTRTLHGLRLVHADNSSLAADLAAVSADCVHLMAAMCQSDVVTGENAAAGLYQFLAAPAAMYAAAVALRGAANAYGEGLNEMAVTQSFGMLTTIDDPYVRSDFQRRQAPMAQVTSTVSGVVRQRAQRRCGRQTPAATMGSIRSTPLLLSARYS